jgi:hypothetical protein
MLITLLGGCATGTSLRTTAADPAEITGTYTLLLYGGRFSIDVETIAFLDREDDTTAFTIRAPDFDYKVIKGIQGKDALARAVEHVKFHPNFQYYRISRILDPYGAVLGYEVRPYYSTLSYGMSDVLWVNYGFKDGSVVISVRLQPEMERIQRGDGERSGGMFRLRR